MARITEIRPVGGSAYEVLVEWCDGTRRYTITATRHGDIQGMNAPDEMYADLPRYPFLARDVLAMVLRLRDGAKVSLPVEIPEEIL